MLRKIKQLYAYLHYRLAQMPLLGFVITSAMDLLQSRLCRLVQLGL